MTKLIGDSVYSVQVLKRSRGGRIIKANVMERDSVIASANRLVSDYWFKTNFYSSMAKARFEDYCDCLSITETIEAMDPM